MTSRSRAAPRSVLPLLPILFLYFDIFLTFLPDTYFSWSYIPTAAESIFKFSSFSSSKIASLSWQYLIFLFKSSIYYIKKNLSFSVNSFRLMSMVSSPCFCADIYFFGFSTPVSAGAWCLSSLQGSIIRFGLLLFSRDGVILFSIYSRGSSWISLM